MCYLTTDLRPNDIACAQTDKKISTVRAYYPGILVSIIRDFKFCDSVFTTQSTDLYDDILVSLVPNRYGLENGVLLPG